MIRTLALTLGLGATLAAPALAHDYRHGGLVIDHPWSRATPDGAGVGAGYMVIRNEGEEADRLVGGAAPFAGRVEIHEMAVEDGVMRMRALEDGLEIPPGTSIALKPGGYHVMFMQLQEPLVEGEVREATLEFANAGPIEVEFFVESMAASGIDHEGHDTPTN